jgi:mRNA interferase RelE/StbE
VAKYSIFVKPSAVKELEAIPLKKDCRRIVERIRKLAEDPRPVGCKKLSGQDWYRIRQGRYRILYSIEDQDLIVYVVKVAQRKDVYR